MKFRIIDKCYQDASRNMSDDVDFLLEENDWNDFGFYTSYHLHASHKLTGKGGKYLGFIRIMCIGQEEHQKYLLRTAIGKPYIFERLPDDFVSMSDSLELYTSVAQYFKTKEEKQEFADALHLILKEGDEYYQRVEDDDCFHSSLCRDTNVRDSIFEEIRDMLFCESVSYNLREKALTIKYANCDEDVELQFNLPNIAEDEPFLPNGMIAFIGKNGSGKSTALYKLAALMYSPPTHRYAFKDLGTLSPSDVYIKKLMIFSYTPFDTFTLPGQNDMTQLQSWVQGIQNHEGRFVYCGLRDMVAEGENMIRHYREGHELKDFHCQSIYLKDVGKLAEESCEAYKTLVEQEGERAHAWGMILHCMETDGHQELREIAETLCTANSEEEWAKVYNVLSTGHKFFFHSIFHILAYIERNTVLMFDEPENHLQAPLLSFMMARIRSVLCKFSSVMLIATHSPIILQELMSSNVRIVRRNGDKVSIRRPQIETFGESFGNISSEVFDMTTDRNTFFRALSYVYEKNFCSMGKNAEEAVKLVENKMGGISIQGINYIVNRYVADNVENK